MKHEMLDVKGYLSNAEQSVNQYVLANLESIKSMSVRELAKKSYTSPNTVMRYCRKLGYGGFEELKNSIQNDLKSLDYEEFVVKDSETIIQVINKMRILYSNVVDRSLKKLSIMQMERILEKMEQVNYVDFIVYDANKAMAEYASHYLFLIGKVCNIYTSIDEQILFAMNAKFDDHIVIIISRSGDTRRLKKVVKILYSRNAYTILFTQMHPGIVAKYCSETINTLYHKDFRYLGDCVFYTSVKYIVDCLVETYYTMHYKQTLERVSQYNQSYFGRDHCKKEERPDNSMDTLYT